MKNLKNMKIDKNSKLVLIGDSITSGARNFDMGGEGRLDEAYGSSYTLLLKSFLDAYYPERRIRIINKGVGGHTIKDLEERWERDVIEQKPDWLSVMIGINDVWRQFDTPLASDIHVSPDRFSETYRKLLGEARQKLDLQGLIVVSPYVIDSNPKDTMRAQMDTYRDISKEVAAEFDAIYVDTQKAFDAYLEHYHPNQLCWDRIHPSMSGHMLIAREWLRAVDFEW